MRVSAELREAEMGGVGGRCLLGSAEHLSWDLPGEDRILWSGISLLDGRSVRLYQILGLPLITPALLLLEAVPQWDDCSQ